MTTQNENKPSAPAEGLDGGRCAVAEFWGDQVFLPDLWTVKKDDIESAIIAVQNGLDYARECLSTHESNLGRTTLKNRTWAERMEEDIRHMERTLTALHLCPNNFDQPTPAENQKPQ